MPDGVLRALLGIRVQAWVLIGMQDVMQAGEVVRCVGEIEDVVSHGVGGMKLKCRVLPEPRREHELVFLEIFVDFSAGAIARNARR